MINIVTLLWDANEASLPFSLCYDEQWVTRLHRGFARHLTQPFHFILFTDRPRDLNPEIEQVAIETKNPNYAACIEPYKLNEPMILVGLDTVVTGNCDHLAQWCLSSNIIALPLDPFDYPKVCNGVALVPKGQRRIFDDWHGENDMDWMRAQPYKLIDSLFPGQVTSYKGSVRYYGLRDTRICYFHGQEKPHQLPQVSWIKQHWLGEGA